MNVFMSLTHRANQEHKPFGRFQSVFGIQQKYTTRDINSHKSGVIRSALPSGPVVIYLCCASEKQHYGLACSHSLLRTNVAQNPSACHHRLGTYAQSILPQFHLHLHTRLEISCHSPPVLLIYWSTSHLQSNPHTY